MSQTGRKHLRHRLYQQDPFCPNCGVEMVETQKDGPKHLPDNTCVVVRRFTGYEKADRVANKKPATIMCLKCSKILDKHRQESVSIEERKARSGHRQVIKHTAY